MKINFTFETEFGLFSDAITLEDDHTYTSDEIEAMKQERLTNWIEVVTFKPIELSSEEWIEKNGE